MSILSILAYIGIGAGSAFVMMVMNTLLSGTKMTYIAGNNVYQGKQGSFVGASVISLLEMGVIVSALLAIAFGQGLIKSIGLSVLIVPIIFVILFYSARALYKPKRGDDQIEEISGITLIFNCILNGVLLAIVVANLDLF